MNKIRKSPLIITKLNLISTVTLLKFTHHLFLSRQFSFFFFYSTEESNHLEKYQTYPLGCIGTDIACWLSSSESAFLK